jgi:hypothetical protein
VRRMPNTRLASTWLIPSHRIKSLHTKIYRTMHLF